MLPNRIFQILHKQEDLDGLLYPAILNLPTAELSYLAMESNVISKAIQNGMHRNSRYFGVLAPGFDQKLKRIKGTTMSRFAMSVSNFTKEGLEKRLNEATTPVVSLVKAGPHNVCELAEMFHPGFTYAMRNLMSKIGVHLEDFWCYDAIYFNYMLMTPEFATGFGSMLDAAIEIMQHDEEMLYLSMRNSTYRKQFPVELQKLHNINYWPMMPFLCERLISLYIKITNTPVTYHL